MSDPEIYAMAVGGMGFDTAQTDIMQMATLGLWSLEVSVEIYRGAGGGGSSGKGVYKQLDRIEDLDHELVIRVKYAGKEYTKSFSVTERNAKILAKLAKVEIKDIKVKAKGINFSAPTIKVEAKLKK
jgi:hypothetical protein